MKDLIQQLVDRLRSGQPLVYCRLVETRGSTPQKAGAAMLVFPDGSQTGTLGGGCVEAEVKRQALAALSDGTAQVCTFQLDNDYGWDDGLICGGRMKILVEPMRDDVTPDYFTQLSRLTRAGQGFTEAIVFDAASSELEAAASFIFDKQQQCIASLHARPANGQAPPQLLTSLRPLAARPGPYSQRGVAYLPTLPRCRLLIVGGGHVGKAVADLASTLDFDIWVVDDREEFVSPQRFPQAQQRIQADIGQVLPKVEITPNTYCLIVTRGHSHDEEALYHLAERGARYVGLIGSRRKIKMIFEDLASEGISAEALSQVHAPVGLDIGSQTVPEIAVSICAELVAHRNCGGNVQGRPRPVS